MKIRDKIVLSNLAIILLISVTVSFLVGKVVIQRLTERITQTAVNSVAGIAEFNYKLSQRILTENGASMVELQADNAALRLSGLLAGKNRDDYKAIRADAKIRRIATAPILLDKRRVGYLDVFDRQGVCVLHPNRSLEGTNFKVWMNEYPKMWELVRRSFSQDKVNGRYEFIDENGVARSKYMVITHVPNTSFNVTAVVNLDDYYASAHRQIKEKEGNLTANVETMIESIAAKTQRTAQIFGLIILAAAAVVSVVFGVWFANSIARPVTRLTDAVQEIGKGDFSARVDVDGDDEVERLVDAFNHLGGQLREHMENLRLEVTARQAVESELKIARSIQRSLLPSAKPPFPDRGEFSLRGLLEPAQEVAGDFYDYFFVDDDTLALVVGDVSGKGIPAAFFMAVTRTLLKSVSLREPDPAKVLSIVNRVLCSENDACMFVTMFFAFYDVRTGALTYANAGHQPAVRLRGDGGPERFGALGNSALGIGSNRSYESGVDHLEPGDAMILYTDGVTEAQTMDEEMWGEERFAAALSQLNDRSPDAICEEIAAKVKAYEKNVLFDDLTILALRRER